MKNLWSNSRQNFLAHTKQWIWGSWGWGRAGASITEWTLIGLCLLATLFQERGMITVTGEKTTDWLWGGPIGLGGCIPGKPKLQLTRQDLWVPEVRLSMAQSWTDALTVGKKQSLHQSLGSISWIWKVVPGRRREGDRREGKATKGEVLSRFLL